MKQGCYKPLKISFQLTEELQEAVQTFLRHINFENGMSEDCYRSEILFWLKDALERKKITRDQYDALKDYYVFGGIYYGRNFWKKN